MNKSNAVWAVIAVLTMWLISFTAKVNTASEDSKLNVRMVSHLMDRMINLEENCCIREQEIEFPDEPITKQE